MVALTAILLIVGFFLLDMGIRYVFKPQNVQVLSAALFKITTAADDLLSDFLLPLGYFFHPGHTWARIQDRGEILIGADDFSQKTLGRIDSISLPKVGQEISLNSPAFKIFQSDKAATFMSPVSGTVVEVNKELSESPDMLKTHPYGSGWIMKVKPVSADLELKSLMLADSAKQWLQKEIGTFRDFLMEIAGQKSQLGMTLADGGVPVSGVMQEFGNEEWNRFQERFLDAASS